jgi:hypothetical protein
MVVWSDTHKRVMISGYEKLKKKMDGKVILS